MISDEQMRRLLIQGQIARRGREARQASAGHAMWRKRRSALLNSGDTEGPESVISLLSPIGWWKFDEGTGTTITNYGSLGSAADLTGAGSGGSWVTGGFDTEATRYFIVGAGGGTLGISGTAARTVIAVGNPQNVTISPPGGWGFEWIGDGANGRRWTFRNVANGAQARLEIAGQGFTESTLTDFAVGTWAYGVASMSSGGTQLQDCDLYINGGTQACTGTGVTIDTIGNFRACFAAGSVADMIIGYLIVFATELSAAQVADVRTALQTIMAGRTITLP